jgi:DNA-binding NtrC family response regulator
MAAASVLIVDDEPLINQSLALILCKHGYDVVSADDPFQALEIVSSNPHIDVVLADVEMPGMRGTALVREIAGRLPQASCVLMTGRVGPVARPAYVPLLRKPLTTADLIGAVEQAIARSAQLRAELRAAIARSTELQKESRQLTSDCRKVRRDTAAKIRDARRLTGQGQ